MKTRIAEPLEQQRAFLMKPSEGLGGRLLSAGPQPRTALFRVVLGPSVSDPWNPQASFSVGTDPTIFPKGGGIQHRKGGYKTVMYSQG